MIKNIISHKRKREENFDEEKNEENNNVKMKNNTIKTSEENTLSNNNFIDINDINNYAVDFKSNPINIHMFKIIVFDTVVICKNIKFKEFIAVRRSFSFLDKFYQYNIIY